MNKEERARQFAPFESLKGLREALMQREKELLKVEHHDITEEISLYVKTKLDEINKRDKVEITFYEDGFYITKSGTVRFKNYPDQKIIVDKKAINFVDILKLEKL